MRAGFMVAIVVALGFAGCGDDTTTMTTTGNDLATASAADMSAVAADMASRSCGSVLSCVAGCGQNLVCQVACRDSGTTAAKGLFDAFAGCVAATCGPGDGGTSKCSSTTDPGATCQTCLANTATQALNAGSPCNTEYADCATH